MNKIIDYMKTNRLLLLLMAVTNLCNLNAQIPNAPTLRLRGTKQEAIQYLSPNPSP